MRNCLFDFLTLLTKQHCNTADYLPYSASNIYIERGEKIGKNVINTEKLRRIVNLGANQRRAMKNMENVSDWFYAPTVLLSFLQLQKRVTIYPPELLTLCSGDALKGHRCKVVALITIMLKINLQKLNKIYFIFHFKCSDSKMFDICLKH